MAPSDALIVKERVARRLLRAALAVFGLACIALVGAATVPINVAVEESPSATTRAIDAANSSDTANLRPLLIKLATSELLRPAQLQAAVKDDGTAQQLLKSLKLQGIIEMEQKNVAYIQVEKQGVKTVRVGETISEFTVEKIEPNRVTLSYRGVIVILGHQ